MVVGEKVDVVASRVQRHFHKRNDRSKSRLGTNVPSWYRQDHQRFSFKSATALNYADESNLTSFDAKAKRAKISESKLRITLYRRSVKVPLYLPLLPVNYFKLAPSNEHRPSSECQVW